jgi:asparagine synthase (glutamine-hydrolysing)
MTDSIAHRGPDGEGWFVRNHVALGNRRLAIIDLDTGDQPMSDPRGEVVVTFNGEIYNYVEIRQELKAFGHRFRTESDTEVLLRAYDHWGLEMLEKLNGMWAFAIWDERRHRLFVSRDRLGEKPLYYATHEGTFVFGSELKCLMAYGIPRAANISMTEIYLALGYVPSPHTYFAGVHKLEPGHFLLVENEKLTKRRYWSFPFLDEAELVRDRNAVNERFEFLLRDAVRLRMRSDVPYGAFLSGGLDSSSIVALMADLETQPTETFTIGFSEAAYDERRLANMVATRFETDHHVQELVPESCDAAIDDVVRSYDEPFGDTSAIATGAVSAQARRRVKMVLTGDGGDETLSGYNAYQTEKIVPYYNRLPKFVRAASTWLLGAASRGAQGATRFRLRRLQRLSASADQPFEERLLTKTMRVDVGLIRRLLPDFSREVVPADEFLRSTLEQCPYHDGFYRMAYFNLTLSLPEKMLTKIDRMSMAHSLEVRVPFLDHRMVEFMCGVHKNVKMPGLERKRVLRDTVGKMLPRALLHAPKRGFGVPMYAWFKDGEFAERARELGARNSVGFEPGVVRSIVDQNHTGERDYGAFIWMLLVLDRWFEK